MKMFIHWPLAVNPDVKRVLLISHGIGMTMQALADNRDLESIDVVDISREIIESSDSIYGPFDRLPLDDPRVNVIIEDGRFFLATTSRRYDLITGEPPPPKKECAIARQACSTASNNTDLHRLLAADALAGRHYREAERHLQSAQRFPQNIEQLALLRTLVLAIIGERERAIEVIEQFIYRIKPRYLDDWRWLSNRYNLPNIIHG